MGGILLEMKMDVYFEMWDVLLAGIDILWKVEKGKESCIVISCTGYQNENIIHLYSARTPHCSYPPKFQRNPIFLSTIVQTSCLPVFLQKELIKFRLLIDLTWSGWLSNFRHRYSAISRQRRWCRSRATSISLNFSISRNSNRIWDSQWANS